jgi:hypothetical protein
VRALFTFNPSFDSNLMEAEVLCMFRRTCLEAEMNIASKPSDYGIGWIGAQRYPAVFVASSAKDAHSLRHLLDGSRWLLVNVPDLAAAQPVIRKLSPRLIICDTEIEGQGSWRDLLAQSTSPLGPPFFVSSCEASETLRAEVRDLGGAGVLRRPFTTAAIGWVIASVNRGGPNGSLSHTGPCRVVR